MKIQEIVNKIAKDPKSMFLTEREGDRFIKEIMQYKKVHPTEKGGATDTNVGGKKKGGEG